MKLNGRLRIRNMPVDCATDAGCESGQPKPGTGPLRGTYEDNPMRAALRFSVPSPCGREGEVSAQL